MFSIYYLLECPPGFVEYNKRCYRFSESLKNWDDARTDCKNVSARYDLVIVDDANEQKFLQSKLDSTVDYWIGLRGSGSKDTYIWVDGSKLVFGSTFNQYPWTRWSPFRVSSAYLLVVPVSFSTLKSHLKLHLIY